MREVLEAAAAWCRAGHTVGLATVVATRGPAPLPVGSRMVVGPAGVVVGSVAGDCVDADVHAAAVEAASMGGPRLVRFGPGAGDLGLPGPTCGGDLEVSVEPLGPADVPRIEGWLAELSDQRPRLLIAGAAEFAGALARIAELIGLRVTICDARPAFLTPVRFPDVELVVDWPHRYVEREIEAGRIGADTAVVVLTHDTKFETPLLVSLLRGPRVQYVGALGSRATHRARVARLREAGLGEDELARLHGPIGLDLGSASPEETAVSIAAELIAHRQGGSGRPLGEVTTPIHARPGRGR